jgi:hypothetical protein
LQRITAELERAMAFGLKQVITLGRCARESLAPIAQTFGVPLVALPHPAAQGLLADAPNRGRGLRLADIHALHRRRHLFQLQPTSDFQ